MKKINRIKYILIFMLSLFVLTLSFETVNGVSGNAYAVSTSYSNVIDDLSADSKLK